MGCRHAQRLPDGLEPARWRAGRQVGAAHRRQPEFEIRFRTDDPAGCRNRSSWRAPSTASRTALSSPRGPLGQSEANVPYGRCAAGGRVFSRPAATSVAPPTRKPRFVSIWTIPRRQPPLRFAASYRRFLTATDTAPTRRISKPSGSPTERKSRATPCALVARGARVRRAFLLPAVNYPQLHPASRTRITAILRDHRQFPALTTHLACFFPVRSPFSADGLITGFAF